MAYECPTCGEAFESRRGLGVHHSRVHESRLPNRTCEACDSEFFAEYEVKYCSEECRSEAVSFEGADNPNYSGGRTEAACRTCGASFEYYPSSKPGLYCPDCVESRSWRTVPSLGGPNNPQWDGGKKEYSCAECGAIIERYPGNITGDVAVCSEVCRRSWLSDAFTGEGHPNWQGGSTGDYGPGWNEVRIAALERDDHQCVHCHASNAELGRQPDVHHIVPVRAFLEREELAVRDAHTLDNVASLCPECHRKAEFGKISAAQLRDVIGVYPMAEPDERML